jgi:hypothetical protein
MKRIGDFSEPWKCPPSLERVFAKRHAVQALRQAKAAKRGRKQREPELTRAEFFAAYKLHLDEQGR